MSNKKRTYYMRESCYMQKATHTDSDGNRMIELYHHKNTSLPKSVILKGKTITYKSAGNKVLLNPKDIIRKKYWRDVIISNMNEYNDIRRQLSEAYPKGRKEVLLNKASRLGIPKADEVVDKYISGDLVRGG